MGVVYLYAEKGTPTTSNWFFFSQNLHSPL